MREIRVYGCAVARQVRVARRYRFQIIKLAQNHLDGLPHSLAAWVHVPLGPMVDRRVKSIRSFGIASRKERCIACGMCDRFCEVGVPVKSFALKGRFFDMSNSSCISCGICISVCPTRVLSFSTTVPLTIKGDSTNSSPGTDLSTA